MRRLISIACIAVLMLAGCGLYLDPYSPQAGMLRQCSRVADLTIRDRCVYETQHSTSDENLVRLIRVINLSPERCRAITDLRDAALHFRFYEEWAGDSTMNYFMRVMPREPAILSDAEISAAVNWAYRVKGWRDLLDENQRQRRACAGLPPTPGPRLLPLDPVVEQQRFDDTMEQLYGN